MTAWKQKHSSIIRSEAYNENSMTPRIIFSYWPHISLLQMHKHTDILVKALHCFNITTVSLCTEALKYPPTPQGTTCNIKCGPSGKSFHKAPVSFLC